MTVVLDSSAILAAPDGEPGKDVVAHGIEGTLVSTLNPAEVVGKLFGRGIPDEQVRRIRSALPVVMVDFDAAMPLVAGRLLPPTKAQGLSPGDRACLAPAMRNGATIRLPR